MPDRIVDTLHRISVWRYVSAEDVAAEAMKNREGRVAGIPADADRLVSAGARDFAPPGVLRRMIFIPGLLDDPCPHPGVSPAVITA